MRFGCNAIASMNVDPWQLLRFIDNILTIMKRSALQAALGHLNKQNPAIQFTKEIEEEEKLPFMAAETTTWWARRDDGLLKVDIFRLLFRLPLPPRNHIEMHHCGTHFSIVPKRSSAARTRSKPSSPSFLPAITCFASLQTACLGLKRGRRMSSQAIIQNLHEDQGKLTTVVVPFNLWMKSHSPSKNPKVSERQSGWTVNVWSGHYSSAWKSVRVEMMAHEVQ